MKLSKTLGKKPIIIAEVGQNHQGSFEIAKKYIKEFAFRGADIIKFQSRNNKELFSEEAYEKKYNSENAFAKTYGKHREKLELNFSELKKLKKECDKFKLKFMVTPFDEKSLESISKIGVDIIKIASFDLGNLPFIDLIAKKKKIVAISTGGGNFKEVTESIKILQKRNIKIILLHCVSEYPCPYNHLGLKNISFYQKKFPKCIIGSSDHFNGILSGPVAYLQGARVFEKHVTLNRAWKGTDHSFALEPEGFGKFVRDIHRTPLMLKTKSSKDIGKEPVFVKLGKSLIANKLLKKGQKIKINDLSGKIFDKNIILVRYSHKVIGKKTIKDIHKGSPIFYNSIK